MKESKVQKPGKVTDPEACPNCGRKPKPMAFNGAPTYSSRVFLCGGCGYLRDSEGYATTVVPSKRHGNAVTIRRLSKDEL